MNDEGFSALTMALTRYIAILFDVVVWEKAFLPTLIHEEFSIGIFLLYLNATIILKYFLLS